MAANNFENYIAWIRPSVGDPTYSLLKAHLIFEELLRAYVRRLLPYPEALEGARLTFAQVLAIARAISKHLKPDSWVWVAIGDLNRIRNMLSHEAQPKALPKKIEEYISLIEAGIGVPLPDTDLVRGTPRADTEPGHLFTAIDVVTFGLYYYTASALGFALEGVDPADTNDLS